MVKSVGHKWTCSEITRFAATTVLLWCFVTTSDVLGHAARGAGLSAVVIEKKNQIAGSRVKPGDITVQQYHRGFATSAFDVTITHPLQKKFLKEEARDGKLQKSLDMCKEEGIHFVPLAWESTGGATETVHETIRKWTELEKALEVATLHV